ncbi:MAG: hypothetical protein HOP19_15595, partial [Acidobacteria bacterium]|nr:hypothetical protein [Acidobacteriota bacterium]
RRTVRWQGAPMEGRPFLRNTTSETLQSGQGYCGEVTRAFINLADAAGIKAQRINLYGSHLHVVAEAELNPGKNVLVDGQNPPTIVELEPLDQVMLRPEYDDYSTLNVRRVGLSWLFARVKLQMGALTYWTENPHALKATFWFGLAGLLISLKGLRDALRFGLKKRGWIHRSNQDAVEAAVQQLPSHHA